MEGDLPESSRGPGPQRRPERSDLELSVLALLPCPTETQPDVVFYGG